MSESPLDPAALLGALSECGVDFVVIGAMAVGVHAEVLATGDLDVMVPIDDEENKQALERALKRLNAARLPASQGGVDPEAGDPYPTLMFQTRHGRLDVLYRPDGSAAYPEIKRRSTATTIGGHEVAVAGKHDLIRMKLAAGRPDDLTDVANLTAPERDEPRRVTVAMKLATGVDPEWACELAAERASLFDPDSRVWIDERRLKLAATRSGLTDTQIEQWAQALADRLHGAEVLADTDAEIEIS